MDEAKNKLVIDFFFPHLYKFTRDEETFTKIKFIAWSAVSIIQSICIYWVPILIYDKFILSEGRNADLWDYST